MTSLLVASEYSNGSLSSLHDIWIPMELLNRTSVNSTQASIAEAGSRNSTSEKGRGHKHRKKKKMPLSANSSIPATAQNASGESPRAEALRSPFFKPPKASSADNQIALYSVDSWMGNFGEICIAETLHDSLGYFSGA